MAAKILYSLSGDKRKKLAASLADIIGADVVYAGAPTFQYRIGDYTVDRYGTLICPENADIAVLLTSLEAEGFHGEVEKEAAVAHDAPQAGESEDTPATDTPAEETPDTAQQSVEESVEDSDNADASTETEDTGTVSIDEEKSTGADSEIPDTAPQNEGGIERLIISIPREGIDRNTISNLMNLTASRASVLRHALQTDEIPILVDSEKITFPWFPPTVSAEEVNAYSRFVEALVQAAKEAKYVNPFEKETDNEKLTMRLFLVTKLGFVGPDFKLARKLLTRNLSGNSSWKNGAPKKQNTPETDSNVDSTVDSDTDAGNSEVCCCHSETVKETAE